MAEALLSELTALSLELGFSAIGVTTPEPSVYGDYFLSWLDADMCGTMEWLKKTPERRIDPKAVMPEVQSVIVLAYNYFQEPELKRGQIARYALGRDYHNLILRKLKKICGWLQSKGADNRPYVDTGPIMEKGLAQRAGLGWQGKHTNLVQQKAGNFHFLACILTTLKLPIAVPAVDRCGSCSRCLGVCPTGALIGPYQMDARRCISYLTIEHKGSIPTSLRPLIGDHLYGCDDCIAVCPWNRFAQRSNEPHFKAFDFPDLRDQLIWSEAEFTAFFEGSPIRRIGRTRWLRNVCVVLGNIGSFEDFLSLELALSDSDPLIVEHAQWALNTLKFGK
jgi:epoxyqueuosine reductase